MFSQTFLELYSSRNLTHFPWIYLGGIFQWTRPLFLRGRMNKFLGNSLIASLKYFSTFVRTFLARSDSCRGFK